MTDYLAYTPSEYAPDAPGTTLHFQRWFENWIAGFEGAAGAPRLRIGALQRLNPGNEIRWRQDAERAVEGGTAGVSMLNLAFMQAGTVRVSFDHRFVSGAAPGGVVLRRRRGGVETDLANYTNASAYVSRTVDCAVLPGDLLYLAIFHAVYVRNLRVKTAGEDLFAGVEACLTGNTYA